MELLRNTRSTACERLDEAIKGTTTHVLLTEPVVMELLAGANRQELPVVRAISERFDVAPVASEDFIDAARAYRATRASGRTVRSLNDCLIATVAARTGAELWHRDADFDVLAEVLADLRVRSLL